MVNWRQSVHMKLQTNRVPIIIKKDSKISRTVPTKNFHQLDPILVNFAGTEKIIFTY